MKCLSLQEINSIAADYIYFKKVVGKYKSKPLQKAFKTFQNECMRKLEYLVLMKVYRYKNFSNYKDLKQDAYEALLSSLDTFDPDKGSFGWWSSQYIKTKVSRAANAHSTIRYPMHKAKKDAPYKLNYIPESIDDSLSPFKRIELSERCENINKVLNELSNEHRMVLNMTFGCNNSRKYSVSKIIKMLGITRSRYAKLLLDAKKEIKKHFERINA